MKKIPLEATLAGAYRFLFTCIVSIIGTIWFPLALFAGLVAGLAYVTLPHAWLCGDFSSVAHMDPKTVVLTYVPKLGPALAADLCVLFIAGLLVRSMITVGLLRHAIGEKKSITFIYFSLGSRVWRMAALALLTVVAVIALEIAVGIVFAVITFAVTAFLPHGPVLAVSAIYVVAGVLAIFLAVYTMVRLFFLMPAVIVAENKISFGRSWSLAGGNFWRIVVVILLVIIPAVFIADIVLYLTVLPVVMTEAIKQHPQGPAEAMAFLKSLWPLLPTVLAIYVLLGIALAGLMTGAIGTAYKSLIEPPKSEPPAAAALPPAEPVVPPEVAPLIPDAPKEPAAPTETTDTAPPAATTDVLPTESAPKIPDAPN